jgi:hypothetical protein
MARSVYDFRIGGLPCSWQAFGTAGSTVIALGTGGLEWLSQGRVVTDPAYAPFVVAGTADGEATRLALKEGNNRVDVVGHLPAGLVGVPDDPLRAEIERAVVQLNGRVKYSSGTASCIMQIAPEYRPGAAVSISAIQVGATSSTIGAALIGTDGWVKLSGAAPVPTADFDVVFDGSWVIG